MSKRSSFSDQVRRAIEASGKSRYRICKEAGIDKAAMSRFMSGERGLTLRVLDRLAEYLGLELVSRQKEGR
jgi:transcriptional regulator with XRE-family HTH domain